MTLTELLFFVLGVLFSVLVGTCFYGKIGWWGILPAPVVGFGSIIRSNSPITLDATARAEKSAFWINIGGRRGSSLC
jgi:hypothetical protein